MLEQEIGPFATAFHRVWLATLLLGLWNGLRYLSSQLVSDRSGDRFGQSYSYNRLILGQCFIAGISFAGNQLLLAWSLTQTSITNSTILTNMTPIWTILLSWLIWKKKFDNIFLIGMGIATIGACLIGIEDWQIDAGNLQGDSVAILASFFNSTYLLSIESVRSHLSARAILLWISALSTLAILPVALIAETQLFPHSLSGWILAILLGLICQILGSGMVSYCLKYISSGLFSLAKLLIPLINTFLAFIFFSEILSFANYVAFTIILVGIYIAQSSSSAWLTIDPKNLG
ncbi:MAG: DMT family transporter [Cyanobacteria bacterium P01_E01_bin.42]